MTPWKNASDTLRALAFTAIGIALAIAVAVYCWVS